MRVPASILDTALSELKRRLSGAHTIHEIVNVVDEGVSEACRLAGGGKMGPEYALGHLLQRVAEGGSVEAKCIEHGGAKICVYVAGDAFIVTVIDNDLLIYAEGCLTEAE